MTDNQNSNDARTVFYTLRGLFIIQRIFVLVPTAFTLFLNTFSLSVVSFFVYKTQSCYAPLQSNFISQPRSICSFPILALSDTFFCRQSALSANLYQLYYPCQNVNCYIVQRTLFLHSWHLLALVQQYITPSTTECRQFKILAEFQWPLKSCRLDQKELEVSKNPIAFLYVSPFTCLVVSTTANCASFWCTTAVFGFSYLYKI